MSVTRALPEGSEVARLLADAEREQNGQRAPFYAVAACELRKVEGGYVDTWSISVMSTTDNRLVHKIPGLPWDDFRPASAGHRLIEHGYMTMPATHFAQDCAAGWRQHTDNMWSAVAILRDAPDDPRGCAGTCEWDPTNTKED